MHYLSLHRRDLDFYSTTGAIILRISYGYEMKKNDDPFVDLADRDSERLVRESRETLEEMVFTPYDFVKDQMVIDICCFAIMYRSLIFTGSWNCPGVFYFESVGKPYFVRRRR